MKVGRLAVELIRKATLKEIKKRRNNYPPHEGFKEIKNVPYIDDGNLNHTFDVLIATENRKNVCVLDIHGGSYIFGEHQDNYPIGYVFVKNGYDFIAMDYIPNDGKKDTIDLVDDLEKNFQYIFSHLEELGIKGDQFVLTGDSAGGHFALLFAELFDDPIFAAKLGYNLPKVDFKCYLVNSPVYNFAYVGDYNLTKGARKRMFGPNYSDKEKMKLLCPKVHLESLKKPLFVSTCKNDFIRVQSDELHYDLQHSDKVFEFMDIQSDDPKVGHVHNVIDITLPESIKVNEAMMKFIDKYI